MRKHLRLGFFGFGVVGQGLYDVLNRTHGIKADVARICVKNREKKRTLPDHFFTYDADDILNDPRVDVVVEMIDDADAAFFIVKTALQRGKSVVSASKKMIANNFRELYELQQETGATLLYEASCCGSIPIIRNLEEYYDNDLLSQVEGICNGTTNYILTKMFDEGVSYESALSSAQQAGFAESNPFLDVSGNDARFKLCLLTAHAFGLFTRPEDIFTLGITAVSARDFQFAREKGYAIKLIARAHKILNNNEIAVYVMPHFVPRESKFYGVRHEYNCVAVQAQFSDEQFFIGKGAGAFPTGSAMLSDVSALTYGYKYEYKKVHQDGEYALSDNFIVRIYYRKSFRFENSLLQTDFIEIDEQFTSKDYSYIIGTISLAQLVRSRIAENTDEFIAILEEGRT